MAGWVLNVYCFHHLPAEVSDCYDRCQQQSRIVHVTAVFLQDKADRTSLPTVDCTLGVHSIEREG